MKTKKRKEVCSKPVNKIGGEGTVREWRTTNGRVGIYTVSDEGKFWHSHGQTSIEKKEVQKVDDIRQNEKSIQKWSTNYRKEDNNSLLQTTSYK